MLHLLRGMSEHFIIPFAEELDQLMKRTWQQLFELPSLSALQWRLLTTHRLFGGFGIHACMDLAPIARVTALAQCPTEGPAAPYFRECFERELHALGARVALGKSHSVLAMVRQSFDGSDVTSVRSLQRRLCSLFDKEGARVLAAELAARDSVMEHHMLNLWAVDDIDSVPDQKGLAAWFDSLPNCADACVNNEEWLEGVHQRLGIPVVGSQGTCMRVKPNGTRCQHSLDGAGIHASQCAWNMVIRRRHSVRDLVASLAKMSGCVVQIEQRVSEVRYSPSCARPIHTADVHITEPCGATIVLDIRTTSRPMGHDIEGWLKKSEHDKLREYGIVEHALPSDIRAQVCPFVIEGAGRLGHRARAVLKHLVELGVSHQQSLAPLSRAMALKRVAGLFHRRLACTLLRLRYRAAILCTQPGSGPSMSPMSPVPPLVGICSSLSFNGHALSADSLSSAHEPVVSLSHATCLVSPAVEHHDRVLASPAVEHGAAAALCEADEAAHLGRHCYARP